jgi:hypothetical protein
MARLTIKTGANLKKIIFITGALLVVYGILCILVPDKLVSSFYLQESPASHILGAAVFLAALGAGLMIVSSRFWKSE